MSVLLLLLLLLLAKRTRAEKKKCVVPNGCRWPSTVRQRCCANRDALVARTTPPQPSRRAHAASPSARTRIQTCVGIISQNAHTLHDFRHGLLTDHHSIFVSYFSAVATNIQLKLKCLELEADLLVYGSQYAVHLQQEMKQLSSIAKSVDSELNALHAKLSMYHGAGQEFDNVLVLYLRIIKDISHLTSDIQKIQSGQFL
ncbi:hypothetical protein BC830DRAFT_114064 [Chytriomyces sp. MP71]|nr:hypothetical protein BC830DRAFT_114064 [Chytriomyces sp. MP71]